jgi:hypothetical protein
MKVKLLTEIDVHEDGVRCGHNCPFMYFAKNRNLVCPFSDGLALGNVLRTDNDSGCFEAWSLRTPACLAAQKDAEGMTWGEVYRDEPEYGKPYIVELLGGRLVLAYRRRPFEGRSFLFGWCDSADDSKISQSWEYQSGDRFYPVPVKEKE